jgi:hypothetical protein
MHVPGWRELSAACIAIAMTACARTPASSVAEQHNTPSGVSRADALPARGADVPVAEVADIPVAPVGPNSPPAKCTAHERLGYAAPAVKYTYGPARPVQPFYQWQSNHGYCGEVSLLQTGMRNGLWASQYNVRLLCGYQSQGDDGLAAGTPLLQSGPDGYCASHPNDNGAPTAAHAAQLLLDVGDQAKGQNSVLTCLHNAGLAAQTYAAPGDVDGQAALQDFVVWVKQQLLAGHWVTTGVLARGGDNTEYDHIVSVVSFGSDHAASAAYDPDEVLYLEDHGAYTFDGKAETNHPAVPPGTASGTAGCTPYRFGIRVGDLGHTRASFDALKTGQPYALAIPDRSLSDPLLNYAFAVTGPLDDDQVALPVSVSILKSSVAGVQNPVSPVVGCNYEAPYIGSSDTGDSCTNQPPSSWMDLQLRIDVEGLTAGKGYHLYRYVFDAVAPPAGLAPVGTNMALAVPHAKFNAQQALATSSQTFVATGPTYSEVFAVRSDQVAVFRAVPLEAP